MSMIRNRKNLTSVTFLSIFVFLLILTIGSAGYFLYAGKLKEIENTNKILETKLQLAIEDNEMLSREITEIEEKIERFRQDGRYEELALWRKLREQLASQLSS